MPAAAGMGWVHLGVALISAAGLLLQLALTRVFSVTQWYHFAFMAVGLGLLGFGASGTALAVIPALHRSPLRTAAWGGMAVVPAVAVALVALAVVPFDIYLLGLQPRQFAYLAAQVAALTLPFFAVGVAVGILLSALPERANSLYAASFLGAGAGAASALLVLPLGGVGSMIAASAAAAAGSAALWLAVPAARPTRSGLAARIRPGLVTAVLAAALLAGGITLRVDLRLSPYKALSQLRRFPDARVEFTARNAVSRVDVVRSSALRSAPGLSYLFPGAAPPLPGATVDGDSVRALPARVDTAFTDFLPSAVGYRLIPSQSPGSGPLPQRTGSGRVLVVGIGVEVLSAVAHRASAVTVVEANPLVVEAARRFGGETLAPEPGGARTVRVVTENIRTYLRRTPERFDLIQIPPQESFQVVASGTYSLAEHYLYTVEAFRDYLRGLAPGGVLVVTRWAQTPPSEEIRAWAAAVTALEDNGRMPAGRRLAALRSLNTVTMLVKLDGFSAADVGALREFAISRRFDITSGPGVPAADANRYNVLPDDVLRRAFTALLDPRQRTTFLRGYTFAVGPIRDDRPFFFHFFRWRQVPQILANLGRTWQPFGGGGYLVLFALLVILSALGASLILAPLRARPRGQLPALSDPDADRVPRGSVFAYFTALGLGYLFVEVPLLQQMVLLLGFPTYAVAVILSMLLVASGMGSLAAPRPRPDARVLLLLAVAIGVAAYGLPGILQAGLGLRTGARVAVIGGVVVPIALLMGMPFPAGIRLLGRREPALIPWAWGINGCASVVASVAAAILQLEWGFRAVLVLGGLAYLSAGAALRAMGGRAGRRAPTPGS